MAPSEEYIEVHVDSIGHETDKAVLVVYAGEDIWVPFSCCTRLSRYAARPSLWVKAWFAKKVGMVD